MHMLFTFSTNLNVVTVMNQWLLLIKMRKGNSFAAKVALAFTTFFKAVVFRNFIRFKLTHELSCTVISQKKKIPIFCKLRIQHGLMEMISFHSMTNDMLLSWYGFIGMDHNWIILEYWRYKSYSWKHKFRTKDSLNNSDWITFFQ